MLPRSSLLGILPLAALLLPAVAYTQHDAVQRYLFAASRLYENLEYERALEQLKRARTITGRTVEDDVAIALYEGILLADMGKTEESVAAFKEGLYLKPDAKLPVKVSPKVVRAFEAVRADVKKELAPILAKQEAERKRREKEAAKASEPKQRVEQQDARADREAERDGKVEQESDRPEDISLRVVTPSDTGQRQPDYVPSLEEKRAGVPVAPIVLGGVAAAAGGAGAFFGLQSRSQLEQARAAEWHDDTLASRDQAANSALIANIAFATAGAAAVGAVVTLFMSPE